MKNRVVSNGAGPRSRRVSWHRPRRLARWRATLFITALVAVLAGCSALQRESPVRQTFLLDPPLPPAVATPQQATLRVGRVDVAAPFRGKTFVYRTADLRYESDFYVEFLVPPASMLAEQTARALVHARPFATVVAPGSATDAQWVLDGFASALYADYRDKARPAAVLDVTYYLTSSANAEQTPRWTREYRQRVPMREATPQAYAEALNAAFGSILADLARDLASASLPKL